MILFALLYLQKFSVFDPCLYIYILPKDPDQGHKMYQGIEGEEEQCRLDSGVDPARESFLQVLAASAAAKVERDDWLKKNDKRRNRRKNRQLQS